MHTIYGPANPISLGASIEPVPVLYSVEDFLAIMADKNLSYHESTARKMMGRRLHPQGDRLMAVLRWRRAN